MIDVGLQSGVKYLWQQDMFVDYTIKVSGHKFPVHKLVLASVSDYFRTMLNGAMMESLKDEVEFTQFSVQVMSELIHFIYTGYDHILEDNSKDFLECAVYFQMPSVIKACTSTLLKQLSVPNCLDILATFVRYSLNDAAAQVRSFISDNVSNVMNRSRTCEMSEDVMRIILKCWKKSDWEMFIYLTTWFSADFNTRKDQLNEFMGRVRFSQLLQREIEAVKGMDVYKDGEGAWKDKVDKASQGKESYEDLPINQKVLADPELVTVRGTKALYIMDRNCYSAVVSKKQEWKDCWKPNGLEVSGTIPFFIEVNNFLITCSEFGENQTWQIFDPRTLTWSKIANMSTPRDEFAMVYHDKYLYVLGGTEESAQGEKVFTDTVEVYSFETNTWSSPNIKLPVPVKNHAACCLNGAIYVSGGELADTSVSDRLDRLDLSSNCWECKAPMSKPKTHHPMFVVKKQKKGVIFIIKEDLTVEYYDPVTDDWSPFNFFEMNYVEDTEDSFRFPHTVLWVPGKSRLLMSGNFLYLLNLKDKELADEEDSSLIDSDAEGENTVEEKFIDIYGICEKWEMIITDPEIKKYQLGMFPSSKTAIACLLAVPKHAI